MRTATRPLLVALALIGGAVAFVGDLLMLLSGATGSPFIAKVAEYFWLDQEANVWSWYSSFLLGATGIGFLVLAMLQSERRARTPYLLLGIAAVVMSADETASLHEALGYVGDATDGITSHWLLLGIPLAVVAGVVSLRLARRIDPLLRRRLIVAGSVYLLGAVVLEVLGGALSGPIGLQRFHPLYVLEVTIEEGLEFTGTLLAVRAVLETMLPLVRRRTEPAAPATVEPTAAHA